MFVGIYLEYSEKSIPETERFGIAYAEEDVSIYRLYQNFTNT